MSSETKYKTVEADKEYNSYIIKLPAAQTFEELKEHTADAFYKGIKVVRFYADYRKKNNYLEVRREQFDKTFIEESYKKLQRQSEIEKRKKRIENLRTNITWNENQIKIIQSEIEKLQTNEHI